MTNRGQLVKSCESPLCKTHPLARQIELLTHVNREQGSLFPGDCNGDQFLLGCEDSSWSS